MKKSVLFLFTMACMMSSLYAIGDIKVTLFGKGGIVANPDGTNLVCPVPDKIACATITIPSSAYKAYNDGVEDVMKAQLTMSGITKDIIITAVEDMQVSQQVVQVYESPDFHAYKEFGVGQAVGVQFKWAEAAELEVASNDMPEVQPIKINIRGAGGIKNEPGRDPVICPIAGKTVCATIEGSVWDLLSYWWNHKPAEGNGVAPGKAQLTVYESGRPAFSSPVYVVGVNTLNLPEKAEGEIEVSSDTYTVKFAE